MQANVLTTWTLVHGLTLAVGFITALAIAHKIKPMVTDDDGTTFMAKIRRALAVVLVPSIWVVIRLASMFVQNPAAARAVIWVAWIIAALNILKLLDPTIAAIDGLAVLE